MTVLFFGIYDPEYSRNRVLIQGLRKNGVTVLEQHQKSSSKYKYFNLALEYLRSRPKFDVMLVGFPGQEVMFLARLLTRKPIVFDAFTSHYGGYILDRQHYSPRGLHAAWYRFIDTWSCHLADKVLLDTEAHIDFFVKEFHLSKKKFKRIFVGTDSDIFYPAPAAEFHEGMLVHFHGGYIPLQGVSIILKAAKLLENENITFNLIGRGQTYAKDRALAESLHIKNVNFLEPVPYRELPIHIRKADVSLGIFGATPKTQLVIPNKIFEAVACARLVISSDTPAIRELFSEQDMVLIKNPSPETLAESLLMLKQNRETREALGRHGHETYLRHATPEVLGRQLIELVENLSYA